MKQPVRRVALAAVVAALYAAVAIIQPFSSTPVQFRVSEALCVLPFFFPASIPGLFAGCLVANIVVGQGLLDIIIGPLATLLAAIITSRLKKRWLAPLPPVLINAVAVGAIMSATQVESSQFFSALPMYAAYIALGEAVVCFALGLPLLYALPRVRFFREYAPDRLPERGEKP